MAVVNINTGFTAFDRDLDHLVVRENYTARDGGVTLDTTNYPLPYIRAGHVVIRQTSNGELKPMPLNEDNDGYGTLPEGHTYYGHTVQTCATNKPFVGVFYHGKINPVIGTDASAQAAGYFDLTSILAALRSALTHMIYEGDNA